MTITRAKNPVARQIMDPQGEPTIVNLLNGHSIKLTTNGF